MTLRDKPFFLCLFLIFSISCSRHRPPVSVPKPAAVPSVSVSAAEHSFLAGKSWLEKGDLEKAQEAFDVGLDRLLASSDGTGDHAALVRDYVERVSALELNFLRDRNEKNNGEHEAFLDEVISAPLFLPSQQEVASLQQKIIAAPQVTYSLPMVVNSQVASFLRAFQTIKHEGIQNALNRSQEYLESFKEVFRSLGMPEDLAYLPIIESGFRVGAVSRARAKGMWQFMAATARLFGLRVDWLVDERLDPFKATRAAARYLKYLHDHFGDWYLALACYNGGPRRVEKAINRLNTKDFFEINQTHHIRRETRTYVPAFIASLIIAKSPRDYGFDVGQAEPIFRDSKLLPVPAPANLNRVAELLGVSFDELKALNPQLLTEYIPTGSETYILRIPGTADETRLEKLERIPASKIPTHLVHRVRKGETIGAIARRYGVSLQRIRQFNNLRGTLIRPGQQLVIPRGGR